MHDYVKPEIFDLTSIVMPKIMNEWELVADALHYDVNVTKSINKKEHEDPKQWCKEFSYVGGLKPTMVLRLAKSLGQHCLVH